MTIQKVKRNTLNTKVNGNTILPLGANVIVSDMNFERRTTSSGIILPGDDGKDSGIRPRWAKVYAIGPEQKTVAIGQWILIAHGRWSRGIDIELLNGDTVTLRKVDINDMLMVSDAEPVDDIIGDKVV
jgi:co-chaperonin GroES (HSP10)